MKHKMTKEQKKIMRAEWAKMVKLLDQEHELCKQSEEIIAQALNVTQKATMIWVKAVRQYEKTLKNPNDMEEIEINNDWADCIIDGVVFMRNHYEEEDEE